jgi:HAD superfamily hydrolase (TIGR01459 family)
MTSTVEPAPILHGLSEIAPDYDGVICDVWGVVHNGLQADLKACEALRRFRAERGRVVLLSNAPRPTDELLKQFERVGVPPDCYDAIMTSGLAARLDLAERVKRGRMRIFHLGPERDGGVYDGLDVELTDAAHCEAVLCTGLYDHDVETPDDYTDILREIRARGLVMLCANPDRVVQIGGKLVPCAGALAALYEKMGGRVVWYGKPFRPIYDIALGALQAKERVLAIGDGLITDLKGANGAGLDALFIADGIHGEEIEPFTPTHLAKLFAGAGVYARATLRTLVW